MRSRLALLTLSVYLLFFVVGCTSKPPADNANNNPAPEAQNPSGSAPAAPEHKEAKREPVVVPAGTAVTVRLGDALGSKTSQAGQTFSGSIAKEVMVGNEVAIPKGTTVS